MIESVIFDLSEVLLPGMIGVEDRLSKKTGISKDRFTRAMGSFPHYVAGNNLDDLLRGRLSYEDYRDAVLQAIGLPLSQTSMFDAACLCMLETPYDFTEEMLSAVAAKRDIYLLSDHCETWARWIQEKHRFMARFKDIVWSYEIGATKREAKPFETILSRNALKADACLFVDDLESNIKVARQVGMRTVHFRGRESIPDVYRSAFSP